MRFVNGVSGSVHLDYVQRPPSHTLHIVGSMGTIEWNNSSGMARLYEPETKQWQESDLPAGFERNYLFLDEMRHFIDVVNRKASPLCTLEDGLSVLKISEAAHKSAKTGSLITLNR